MIQAKLTSNFLYPATEREKIFAWLSSSTMPQNGYDSALEKCLEDTASWIFKEEFFLNWKQGVNSLLRLIGKRKSSEPLYSDCC